MTQLSLFYPLLAGHQKTETSKAAAEETQPLVRAAHREILELLKVQDLTADEMARAMKRSILFIRPRITELNKLGEIVDSGRRRPNASGKKATVWRLA